jgi:hypothetical protein
MNQLKTQLLCFTALVTAAPLFGDGTTSKIVPRSQSFNAARQIVGWDNPTWGINRKPQPDNYQSFNVAFEYSRTFRDNRLAQALFGNDLICSDCDETSVHISGSGVANRAATDWLGDYFGLPRDFESTVSFKPSIRNYILDFSFYAGLDSIAKGLYFKIYGPFVHTKWNLNATECISNAGTAANGSYFQGYFSSAEVPTSNLNTSFLSYANGATPIINNDYDLYGEDTCYLQNNNGCTRLGDIDWQSLCCSKISPECGCDGQGLSRNGFAELRFILGYNFINDEAGDYHAGLGLYVAAPTGTRVGSQSECNSKGRYLFEPIVGNGKHWELGGQVTAHHIFWKNEQEDKSLGLYIEANVTHLFGANQIRCFDLCSAGSNSRYMLAEQLGTNRNTSPALNNSTFPNTPVGSTFDTLGLEFANAYAPVANITRSNVTSTISAQGDIAFSFAYQSGNFQWDLGYNFWGRSCERLSLSDSCCEPALGQWALKGDQRVYGFTAQFPTSGDYWAISIPATDSQADIHTGSNMANGVSYVGTLPTEPKNFYADNSLLLRNVGGTTDITTLPVGSTILYTSERPVLIQESDFDLAGTRGISNKLFTHLNYAWPQAKNSKYTPYMGFGAEVEFGGGNKGCCDTGCDTPCNTTSYNLVPLDTCNALKPCCTNVALSQWGVWFKLGASYN